MERNIVEILVILLRQYPDGGIKQEDFEPLTEDLIGLGYTKQEIESALFWFYNKLESESKLNIFENSETDSYRVLHEVERAVLTPQAHGYLVELRHLGIISLTEMDRIIERAVLLGGYKVTIDDIKSLVASQMLDQEIGFSSSGNAFHLRTPFDKIQ